MKKIFFGWYIVLAGVLLSAYISGTLVYGFTAFMTPLSVAFGWSFAELSLATSIRGMESGALSPLLGYVVDRWPARRLVFIGVIALGLGVFLLSRTDSLVLLYTSFLVIGLGTSLAVHMVPTVVIARWFKRDIGKANGVLAMGMGIGGALIPLLVKMIDTYGLQGSLTVLAIGAIVLGLPLAFLFRNSPEEYGLLPDNRQPEIDTRGAGRATGEPSITSMQALRMRAFWQIGLFFMIQIAVMMAIQTHIMPSLENMGIDRTTAGVLAMALPLVSLGVRIPFGWGSDIFPKKYMAALSLGLKAAGLLVFSMAGRAGGVSMVLIIIFVALFGLGSGGMTPLRAPLIREYFGTSRFGTILGLMSIFTTLGLSLGPLIAGWVFDSVGNYAPVWLAYGAASILGVALILAVPSAGLGNIDTFSRYPEKARI